MTIARIVSLLALAVLILVALSWLLPGTRSRTPTDAASRDDDRFSVFGLLYTNPDDPSWRVPKRDAPGWTLNIGHPVGRLMMLGLVGLMVVLALFAALVPEFNTYGCHPLTGCHFSPRIGRGSTVEAPSSKGKTPCRNTLRAARRCGSGHCSA